MGFLVFVVFAMVALRFAAANELFDDVCLDFAEVPECEAPMSADMWVEEATEAPEVGRKCDAGSYSLSTDGDVRIVNSQHDLPVENAVRVYRATEDANYATPIHKMGGKSVNYWLSDRSYARTIYFITRMLVWTMKIFLP